MACVHFAQSPKKIAQTRDLGSIFSFLLSARRAPFTVGVNFDSNEVTSISVADAKASTRETSEYPGGITGFKLIYFQVAC